MPRLSPPIRLNQFQTSIAIPLESYVSDTYERRLTLSGNSLLSTVYVTAMDPGATLQVNYWEYTTGELTGERRDIAEHPLISAGDFSTITPHIKIVAPFHREPQLEAIVTGGNVEFSVYLTCLTSFASAQDNSLILDGDTFDPLNDLAQPIACLDEDTNTLNFLRCKNGVIPSDPIYLGTAFRESGTVTPTPGTDETLTSFTVTSTSRLISTVRVTGRQPGRWRLLSDSSLVCSGRIGAGNHNDTFDIVPRETIANGSLVELKFESRNTPNPGSDVDYHILGADL
jgi:hypothetical protein